MSGSWLTVLYCTYWLTYYWLTVLNDLLTTECSDCTDWLYWLSVLTDWLYLLTYWLYWVYWLYWLTVLNDLLTVLSVLAVLIECTDWQYCIYYNDCTVLYCTDCPTNSMQQCIFSEANSFSATEEITGILWKPTFSAAFTRARHLSLSSAKLLQSTSSLPVCVRPILILSYTVRIGFPCSPISSDFPTKTLYRLSSPLSVPHAPPISSPFDHPSHIWWALRSVTVHRWASKGNIACPSLSVVTQRNAVPWPTTGISDTPMRTPNKTDRVHITYHWDADGRTGRYDEVNNRLS